MSAECYVIVIGNFVKGFKLYGPYLKYDAAAGAAVQADLRDHWTVVAVEPMPEPEPEPRRRRSRAKKEATDAEQ